ncbi:MAG TPA: MlaD family protein [Sphingomicrobium sp.]|jgi:phospholipid/cholesterol/gamma-HCH transport system substrate-binding protein|nr:MlaD family protein [Sphingomicrobium sp.]
METRSNYVMVGTVTVALLVGVLLFIVWLAGLSNKATKCYDIYFAQGVGGLNKGSNVSFSGVPVGQITKISLLPNRPEFVWVRVEVDEQTPVLQGTTAQIKGVGFTGVSEIQLDGAVRGSPPISQPGPQGCPVVPSSTSGLGALLNSAPELVERLQRLTERLTELLGDKNQNAISDILENIDVTTAELRKRSPELGDTIAEIKIASHNAGLAAQNIAALGDNTNKLVTEQGRPAIENLNKAIVSARQAADNLNDMITDARPGVQNFSKSTLPEASKLVHDLRSLSESLQQVSDRVNQQGIGGTLGPEKLPDYKPGKRK